MIREHLILICFIILFVADLIFVLRGGVPTRKRLIRGLCALCVFGILSATLSWLLDGEDSFTVLRDVTVSYSDAGIAILFISLATLGCWCADRRE
jgi:cytosine/uracil/thiamine/allantoin permease